MASKDKGSNDKGILSSAGWAAADSDDLRHAALAKAIRDHGVRKVISGLKWVEKEWKKGPVAKKTRSDIEWLFHIYLEKEKIAERETFVCRKCGHKALYDFVRCPECTETKNDD